MFFFLGVQCFCTTHKGTCKKNNDLQIYVSPYIQQTSNLYAQQSPLTELHCIQPSLHEGEPTSTETSVFRNVVESTFPY